MSFDARALLLRGLIVLCLRLCVLFVFGIPVACVISAVLRFVVPVSAIVLMPPVLLDFCVLRSVVRRCLSAFLFEFVCFICHRHFCW
jgi:hypothetical protein